MFYVLSINLKTIKPYHYRCHFDFFKRSNMINTEIFIMMYATKNLDNQCDSSIDIIDLSKNIYFFQPGCFTATFSYIIFNCYI